MAALAEGATLDLRTLANYEGAQDLVSLLQASMPECFLPGPNQVEATPEACWLQILTKIAGVHAMSKERRRFILHWPAAAPFDLSILLDVSDPAKACGAPLGAAKAGDPLLAARYVAHRKAEGQEAGQAKVLDFYKRQRDGFLNEEAAVVPLEDSVVGLQAPSLAALERALAYFAAQEALLSKDYKALFDEGPKATFLGPMAVDASGLAIGAYVELHGMKTAAYDGLAGLILGKAENHPDRWAVMPQTPDMVAKAVKLRGGDAKVPLRPVAIKPECLRVIPRPKAAEAEECD
ncbi:hypothetical protein SO694_00007624 [Aureococcus anophagefferens]|uniref:Uncharacterized protein n=1 Tax=Aureococcus anophagefferens TaxID=44056 RepID=A0ABR1GBK3_AURAN